MQLFIEQAQLFQAALALLQRDLLALQAFEQFVKVDRFLVIVGDTGAQGADHVFFLGPAGEQDGLEQMLLAADQLHGLDQLDAVHAGHVQVAQDQPDVGRIAKPLDGFAAVGAGHAEITMAFEKLTELFDNQRLIVDHQNLYRRILDHA